jgi:hypothetical protein
MGRGREEVAVKALNLGLTDTSTKTATPRRSNTLKHGCPATQICIRYEEDNAEVRLFFEDDGVGIPDDLRVAYLRRKASGKLIMVCTWFEGFVMLLDGW